MVCVQRVPMHATSLIKGEIEYFWGTPSGDRMQRKVYFHSVIEHFIQMNLWNDNYKAWLYYRKYLPRNKKDI